MYFPDPQAGALKIGRTGAVIQPDVQQVDVAPTRNLFQPIGSTQTR